jgi:hypothetical protein
LPPGQIIDIPYLKQLAIKAIVPIAYCIKTDFDILENFVPAYLLRFTTNIWQLLDVEDIVLRQHNWEDGDDSILNLFGTYMQHPEEQFVVYFGGTPVAAFEQGRPPLKEGSPRRSPRKTPEQSNPVISPMKTPDVLIGTDNDLQKLDEELNVTTETTSAAATVPEAVATRAVAAKIASNNNANPRPNVQEHPRKVNYRLPLNKHRPSTAYYHPAFTTYSRHNRCGARVGGSKTRK